MQPETYLKKLLTESCSHEITSEEQKSLDKVGLEDFIYSKLTSKKFRKFKMADEAVAHTKNAIKLHLSRNDALQIVYPQGGYKLWRFPSSPNADWAEYFAIAYVLSYIAPIAKVYAPGVSLKFYLHTLLMEMHDNLTTEEIQSYVDSFEKLLASFRKYLPTNVTISLIRDADLYTRDEYFEALEEQRKQVEIDYQTWPDAQKEDFARMARLNIKWSGREDWTVLSESEKEKKIYLAALYEKAVTQLPKVNEKIKSAENILLFTKAAGSFIGIGSTKASIAKYWVGYGVLVKQDEAFLPVVLTPSQYEKCKDQTIENVKVDTVEGENFSSIWLLSGLRFGTETTSIK